VFRSAICCTVSTGKSTCTAAGVARAWAAARAAAIAAVFGFATGVGRAISAAIGSVAAIDIDVNARQITLARVASLIFNMIEFPF
jgi:hypothetical protein